MKILGISGGFSFQHENLYNLKFYNYHDAAAVLVEEGKVTAGIEEERLNRIKHTNKLPVNSVRFCLDRLKNRIDDVDKIAVYFLEDSVNFMIKDKIYWDRGKWEFSGVRELIQRMFREVCGRKVEDEKINFVSHHLAHAESAYWMSGFDESLTLVMDAEGDAGSGIIQSRKNGNITHLDTFSSEASLGVFYDCVIEYLGYENFDEYKVMGLAPYGNPERFRNDFRKLYTLLPKGRYVVKRQFIPHVMYELMNNKNLTFRKKGEPFTQDHKDIAASLQELLETIVLHVLKHYREETGHKKLCLAGGVSHNCSLNGKILYSGLFDDIFVQPAAHDAGAALGAALYVSNTLGESRQQSLKHVYWGTDIGNDDAVLEELKKWEGFIMYEKKENISESVAGLLSKGYVAGWVQGCSEFGPRALGNRSIVADPRPAENKNIINEMIKKREAYRPFAPSLLEEDIFDYYEAPDGKSDFPFMNFVLRVKGDKQKILGAVTHTDCTARVQTVSKSANPLYWNLINEFKKLTGIPVVLNTSFNNNAEPIVDSVKDAIVCYLTTRLHYLAVGNYLISKKKIEKKDYLSMTVSLPLSVRIMRIKQFETLNRMKYIHKMVHNYKDNLEIEITGKMFELLDIADGHSTLKDLLARSGQDAGPLDDILDELIKLWEMRYVILTPG